MSATGAVNRISLEGTGRFAINRKRFVVVIVLLIVVACDSPRPTPTPAPSISESPAVVASAAPSEGASPTPSRAPSEPSAVDLITKAVLTGEIDEATGYLYRFYAKWGDARLPEAYRGLLSEDSALASTIEAAMPTFAPEMREQLRPFVLRPTHPESYWVADPASKAAAASERRARTVAFAPLAAVNDPRCTNGLWARRDLVNIPVTIWGRCREVPGGGTSLGIEAEISRVARVLTQVWDRMVGDMGPPVPDRFALGVQGVDEVDEAGDGRLDIYLTEAPNITYGRNLDTSRSGGHAGYAAPFDAAKGSSASFFVVDVARDPDANNQEATIVHELFHILQIAHNAQGTLTCEYPDTSTACAHAQLTHHWFVEASATWAVHEYLPTRRAWAYRFFERFRLSPRSLMSTADENEYESWMWSLFMEQETLRGPGIMGDAWSALEYKRGWAAVQSTLSGQLGFETSFRDFAVRVWNEKLPGDPIDPRFQHPNLDDDFPETRPDYDGPDEKPGVRFLAHEVLLPDQQERFTVDLPELWAGYTRLDLPPGAHRLTLNFSGLSPNGMLDADALVLIRDGEWERRKLTPRVNEWCLDRAADAIEDVILVLSNHSQTPDEHVKGDWTAQADSLGCITGGDGLVYSFSNQTGDPATFFQTHRESLTLRLSLTSSPDGFGLIDDGNTTFRGSIEGTTFLAGVTGGNCNLNAAATGGGGGPIPGDGGVSASFGEKVVNAPAGSSAPPRRIRTLVVSASIPIDVTTVEESCIGSTSGVTRRSIQLPTCEGTEVVATSPSTQVVFDFNCSFQGDGQSWSLSGKVRLGA